MATTLTRGPYRANTAKIYAAVAIARKLLDLYSWQDIDGQVFFLTEPNPAMVENKQYFDIEVKSLWYGLQKSLVIAGIINADQTPLPLDGIAQFLRVEIQKPVFDIGGVRTGFRWNLIALFEVLRGVNSYGYADGSALDTYYSNEKAYAVRVLRETLPLTGRTEYLANDRYAVTDSTVVGQIDPHTTPDVATGWAVISNRAENPEPDFYGIDDARFIVIPGEVGPAGADGAPGGPPGPAGAPGAGAHRPRPVGLGVDPEPGGRRQLLDAVRQGRSHDDKRKEDDADHRQRHEQRGEGAPPAEQLDQPAIQRPA